MSEPKSKPPKSPKAPKSPAPAPAVAAPDVNGPDTFDRRALVDFMRALRPHAGAGVAAGAVHLKSVLLKCDGNGSLRAVCKGLTGTFTMVIRVSDSILPFREFVEPDQFGSMISLLKGDRVVVRFNSRKVELFGDNSNASLPRSVEVEGQRTSFDYDDKSSPDLGICVRASALRSVLGRASKFMYKETDKPDLSGVHLSIVSRGDYRESEFLFNPLQIANGEPKSMLLRLSATDGARLFVEHVGIERVNATGKAVEMLCDYIRKAFLYSAVMPQITAFLSLLSDDAEVWIAGSTSNDRPSLSLYSEEYQAHLEIQSSTDIDYPDYTRVMPIYKPHDTRVTAPLLEFVTDARRFNDLAKAHGDLVADGSWITIMPGQFDHRQSKEVCGNNPHVFVQTPVEVKQQAPICYCVNRVLWAESVGAVVPDHSGPDDKITMHFFHVDWGKDPNGPISIVRDDLNRCFQEPMNPFVLIMPMLISKVVTSQ